MCDLKSGCPCGSCKQRKRLFWNLHKSQEIPKMDQRYHKKRKMLRNKISKGRFRREYILSRGVKGNRGFKEDRRDIEDRREKTVPKTDVPKTDVPKTNIPKTDVPKIRRPKDLRPKDQSPKDRRPKDQCPKD